jgi:hypothetical protein
VNNDCKSTREKGRVTKIKIILTQIYITYHPSAGGMRGIIYS